MTNVGEECYMTRIEKLLPLLIMVAFLSISFGYYVEAEDTNRDTSKLMTTCKTCGQDISINALTCPYCGENLPALRVLCPKCQSTDIILDKQGFSTKKAAVGCCLLGGVGLAGGAIGMHENVYVCRSCGYRWKAQATPNHAVVNKNSKTKVDEKNTGGIIVILVIVIGVLTLFTIN